MSISQNFQDILPSLNLNFANAQALDPRVSFSRSSTGTYIGPDGLIKTAGVNVPRFTYDPLTGKSLGLLIEESMTNFRTYSTAPNSSNNYRTYGTVTQNATIAPDGTNTAALIVGNGSINQGFDNYPCDYGNNSDKFQTISLYVKNLNANSIAINFSGGYQFTFSSETGVFTSPGILSAGFQKLLNGWYRIWITGYKSNPFSVPSIYIDNGSSTSNGVYFWGIQIENGFLPSSYIPTTNSTITRSLDIANIFGTNFSNFYNTSGGSIFITATPNYYINGNTTNLVTLSDGTSNNYTSLNISTGYTGSQITTVSSGVLQSNVASSAYPYDASSITSTFAQNNFGININSAGIGSTSSGTLPVFTQIQIGTGVSSYNNFNGTIRSLSYYPNLLNNTSLNSNSIIASTTGVPTTPANNQYEYMIRVGAGTTYTLLTNNSGTYSYNVDWGDGTVTNNITTNNPTKTYSNAGVYRIIVTQNTGSFYFYNGTDLKNGPLVTGVVGAGNSFSWNTDFGNSWTYCTSLTTFPLLNTSNVTRFVNTWYGCSSLTSFPLLNVSNGTNFNGAWYGCYSLTSFPLLNTSSGTNFQSAWTYCASLTSFPLLNVSSGTNFTNSWYDCSSLTSFPSITFGGAGNTNPVFNQTWYVCSKLTTFPAGAFNACTGSTNYTSAWQGCALTATSIENILTSIVSSGATINTPVPGNIGLSGGSNASYSTWTSPAITAYNTLVGAGWTISYNTP